ncbi:MAG: CRISPR-associated endonuclease Cas2 [Chloroflexota bacterium]
MFIVVTYDIPGDHRRNRVAKALEGFGYRVQFSVFECEVDEAQFRKMREKVAGRINPEEDSVRYYLICQSCLAKIIIDGLGQVQREKPLFVV